MTQILNQFAQSSEKGQVTLLPNEAFSCQIDPASVADFTNSNGFAVKIVNVAGKLITVDLATLAADDVFGFIPLREKTVNYVKGDPIGIISSDGVMIMEASAAIARGALVEILPTGNKVVTKTSGTTVGRALDQASADGDLIRIRITVT